MSDIHPLFGSAHGGASAAGYHQVASYLTCPKEFQFEKVRGISIPRSATPDYFAIGTMVHAGRAIWLGYGHKSFAELYPQIDHAMMLVEQEYETKMLPVGPSAKTQALQYVKEYIEYYSMREHPEPVAIEYAIGPSSIGGEDRTARLDDVGYYPEGGGSLWIGECKTTSTDIGTCRDEYALHGQPLLQVLLWRASPQGAAQYGDVAGVMLDVVVKGYGGKPCKFQRVPIEVTEHSLKWYEKELAQAVRASKQVTWDSEPERRISSCTRMIGTRRVACKFRDLCQHGRDAALSYVTADGNRLTDHQPEEGKQCMPWE